MSATAKEKLANLVKELRGRQSQRSFAKRLNVSNQSIGLWEQARNWPDDENLKKLAAQKGWSFEQLLTFLEGEEDSSTPFEEIAKGPERSLTFRRLLAHVRARIIPDSLNSPEEGKSCPPNSLPNIVGGQPPEVPVFYGRGPELAMLKGIIVEERCVVIHGAAGIGKSTLVAKFIQQVETNLQPGEFKLFIWKSVYYAPPLDSLLTELLNLLGDILAQTPVDLELPESTQDKVTVLIEFLKTRRCLLVLDAAEVLLKGEKKAGGNPYGEYAEYGKFLRRIVEEQHQSCLILTSREPFLDIRYLQEKGQPACLMKLEGLGKEAIQIFQDKELTGETEWGALIQKYRGNPLALQIITNRIREFFNGDVEKFLNCNTTWIGDPFLQRLEELFEFPGFLTKIEKQIIFYLVEEIEKGENLITFSRLLNDLKFKEKILGSTSEIIEASKALIERSLIEESIKDNGEVFLSLEPMTKKYVVADLKPFNDLS